MQTVTHLIAALTAICLCGCGRDPDGGADKQNGRNVCYRCTVQDGEITDPPHSVTALHQRWDSPGMAHLVEGYPAIPDRTAGIQRTVAICHWLRARIRLGEEAFKHPLYVPAMLKRLDATGGGLHDDLWPG